VEYKIKLFYVDPYWTTAKSLMESLANVEDITSVGEANKYGAALIKIKEQRPDIVLIDDGMGEDLFRLAEEITQRFINTAVIVLGKTPADDSYRRMMQAGVRDLVKKPVEPAVLVEAIYAAYEYLKKRQLQQPAQAPEETQVRKGKVITVFSTKGGVGKTTVAVNLAVSMAKNYVGRTMLWDLDLHHGVVAVATNITPRRHITDMLNEIQFLDEDLLESYLERHESGLRVLPAPFTPEFADFVSGDHIGKVLSVARERWDCIVVDTPSFFNEPTIEVLKHSDLVLLVGSLDLSAIKNLKACLIIMNKLNFPRTRVKLVLNRVGREFGISPKDIENTLGMPVFATIPADAKTVITGLNQGVPAAFSAPNSDFGRSVQLLAKAVLGAKASSGQPAKQKKGLFNRLAAKSTGAGG